MTDQSENDSNFLDAYKDILTGVAALRNQQAEEANRMLAELNKLYSIRYASFHEEIEKLKEKYLATVFQYKVGDKIIYRPRSIACAEPIAGFIAEIRIEFRTVPDYDRNYVRPSIIVIPPTQAGGMPSRPKQASQIIITKNQIIKKVDSDG